LSALGIAETAAAHLLRNKGALVNSVNRDGGRRNGQDASRRPLQYQRAYDVVLALIESQNLQEGDRLPSNAELAELSGVSLISVRRALDELAQVGKIIRRQGLGTFVASKRIPSQPSRAGALLETLGGDRAHVNLTTSLVSVVVGFPSTAHEEALGLQSGEPVWEVCRLRSVDGTPKILEKAVLPLSRVPALDEASLARGESLYQFLHDRYGVEDEYEEQSLEVDRPNSWEREMLSLKANDTIMRIRGVSFGADGVAFDSYQQTYLAHEFVFYTAGSGSPQLLRPDGTQRWSIAPMGSR
jgi:DNA-binding GntR family transcriptional regulator